LDVGALGPLFRTAGHTVLFSTGPPGDRGALHGHWNAIATQQLELVPFQARGILPVIEEQSRPRGGQSGGIADQPEP